MISPIKRQKWANVIRKKRKAAGLSQEEVASMSLGIEGYSLSYYQKLENGMGSEASFEHFVTLLDNFIAIRETA